MLALALTAALAAQAPLPVPPETPLQGVLGKLVVLADTAGTNVFVDGVARGLAPVSLDGLEPGHHSVSLQAPRMPPFHVDVEVADGRTEVSAKIAQHRPGPDFPQRKAAYDDAMFSVGWKCMGGLCASGLGGAALGMAGVLALVPATAATAIPLAAVVGGALGCVSGTGLCGLGFWDIADSPEEPIIPRVHVVTITPPSGPEHAKVLNIEAPPVDSDGDPIADDDDDEAAPPEPPTQEGIVEASFRY